MISRFAEVTVRLKDYPDEESFDVMLLLDTIQSEAPALSSAENRKLYDSIMADYEDIPSKRNRMQKVKENKYFNALQVEARLGFDLP